MSYLKLTYFERLTIKPIYISILLKLFIYFPDDNDDLTEFFLNETLQQVRFSSVIKVKNYIW